MTSLFRSLARAFDPYPPDVFSFSGNLYPAGLSQTITGNKEEVEGGFEGYVRSIYQRNGVVFACIVARQFLFAQAHFRWQRLTGGEPGDLFGTPALDILDRPWPGGVTGDLLRKMLLDADLAGTAFIARRPDKLVRLRPDWVTIILGSYEDPDVQAGDPDAEILGYLYYPGGRYSSRTPIPFLRSAVAQYSFIEDPLASFRGMSWLTPLVREVEGDSAATTHKLLFFENGATPNMVVRMGAAGGPPVQKQQFEDWVETFKKMEPKSWQAYKTLYLANGAEASVVGSDLKQMDFKITQGHGETRIAAAARVPPIIVGLSEGLEAATYSNYGQARRAFADNTILPMWADVCASLETIVPPPDSGSRLWYSTKHASFLREDRKDAANIQQIKAVTIRQLVDSGYKPESVIKAVDAEDMTLLQHSGLFSVQLQEPGLPEPTITVTKPEPKQITAGRAVEDWRCSGCGHKLAEAATPGTRITCRCKTVNTLDEVELVA